MGAVKGTVFVAAMAVRQVGPGLRSVGRFSLLVAWLARWVLGTINCLLQAAAVGRGAQRPASASAEALSRRSVACTSGRRRING